MKIIKNIGKIGKMMFYRILVTSYNRFQRIFWELNAREFYEQWGG